MLCQNCEKELPEMNRTLESGTSALPKRRGIRILVPSLLLLTFTVGFLVSGWFAIKTGQAYLTPFREAELSALDENLTRIKDSESTLADLRDQLSSASREIRQLEASLKEYRSLQAAASDSAVPDSSPDALLSEEFFSSAYRQYIDDLLCAFMRDAALDEWFYTYYRYAVGQNICSSLVRDIWIYDPHGSGDEKFSPAIQYSALFCANFYADDLRGHLAQNERLYVTGSDLLSILFQLPGYAIDNAVFVKVCGGSPNPEEMLVPGWTAADYREFWEYPDTLSDADYAIWEEFGLSAEEFPIDWNALFDESAYYDAYVRFMDAIAPGQPRLEMAEYLPDDTYYGGFRCSLSGAEPSLAEIGAAYVEAHPERFESREEAADSLKPDVSYEEEIDAIEAQLAELNETRRTLQRQRYALEELLRSATAYRDYRRTLLLQGIRRASALKKSMYLFCFFCCFLLAMIFAALSWLIGALRKPAACPSAVPQKQCAEEKLPEETPRT